MLAMVQVAHTSTHLPRCCPACSPFSYALRAIVINEMTNDRWSAAAPGNPHHFTLGEEGLDTFGFFTERYWIWVGVCSCTSTAGVLLYVFCVCPVCAFGCRSCCYAAEESQVVGQCTSLQCVVSGVLSSGQSA